MMLTQLDEKVEASLLTLRCFPSLQSLFLSGLVIILDSEIEVLSDLAMKHPWLKLDHW